MSFSKKIAYAAISASLAAFSMTPFAFADTTLEIIGNGENSENKIEVTSTCTTHVTQTNGTSATISIGASSNTGGNSANGNTGPGNVKIDTGNATTTVGVNVTGGNNTATLPDCCCDKCDGNTTESIKRNGKDSKNTIKTSSTISQTANQNGGTSAGVGVGAKAKTGKNKANNNTNGNVDVLTGNAATTVGANVTGGSNTLNP